MPKGKQITLTETELPQADLEAVRDYVAAKRAEKQAQTVLEKLSATVRKLARKHPDLLVDGARITVGTLTTYKYSLAMEGFKTALSKAQAEERDNGTAKAATTSFPIMRELSKFTGQAVAGITPTTWGRIFGRKS